MTTTTHGIPDALDGKIWDAMLAATPPGYKVVPKEDSLLSWMAPTFASTIGLTTMMPRAAITGHRWPLLGHEQLHGWDYVKAKVWWVVSYLFPQYLAVLAVGAVGTIRTPWCLLFLLALGFIFAPAPGRTHWERRGYMMSIVLYVLKYGESFVSTPAFQTQICGEFTGAAYLFMDPFKGAVAGWVHNDITRGIAIARGDVNDPDYSPTVALVRAVVAANTPAVA